MTIRWLHLSDTHFREDELWDRRATLNALITKVRELKDKGLAPHVVFVTGDIAWSGKQKEYVQATLFFHKLNEVLELDLKDRWFLVPGNHDVDRSLISQSDRFIQAGLTNERIVEEILRQPRSMRLLSARLEAYYAFTADFLGPTRALQADRPWRIDVRKFGGVSVGILQLNSAWIAEGGEADNANLLIGEAQVREALDATSDAFLRIALVHHPLRNLREFDAHRVESLLGSNEGAAFLLRGHLHLNKTEVHSPPDGNLIELAAGTLYTGEPNWPRGFHLGEVDLNKGHARVHMFLYSAEGIGFFAYDNHAYKNVPNGICKIKLSSAYRLGGTKTKPAKAISEDQRLSFTTRYRNAAAAYHGQARFIGFPNQGTAPNARVSDLFVPLRMKPRGETKNTAIRTTAEIAHLLLGPLQHGSARVVVLGDPGSGKTTLSRFLVMLAAGAITMSGVEVRGEPLPLRIPFRDFVERQRENPNLSLLDYLDLQAKNELTLSLPKDFLRKAIDDGHAILFLDGLDEVGAPEHRASMRDLVAAFSAAHGRVPMLITSRIAGYDDAPLSGQMFDVKSEHVLVAFHQLVLQKFDDDSLRAFAVHWYSVQEPTDLMARERGISGLLTALEADQRVRELARTPILATLIAMIHRVAKLPGDRAKLYEVCVRMLLETWPKQANRSFSEIDPGLQRAYLDSLAFDMQTGRSGYFFETITIKYSDLVSKLLPILRKREFANQPIEIVVRVIERWIDHLEKHTGILVEQSAGIYAFFHLSIMEYLAAHGMARELGRVGCISAIAEHYSDPAWREICLLSIGSHAEDEEFLDAVYAKVAVSFDIGPWDFLLRCLREEARFGPNQRESILGSYASALLGYDGWLTKLPLVDQIQHFSDRHGEAVQRWIENRLDHSSGEDLVATMVMAFVSAPHAVLERLANRRDRPRAAGALLEFWPGSEVGVWASEQVGEREALNWSFDAPHELMTIRGIAAIRQSTESLAAATVIALNGRTVQGFHDAADNIGRVAKLSRPGGSGLPAYVRVTQDDWTLTTAVRIPYESGPRASGVTSRFARAFARHCAGEFSSDFATHFVFHNVARNFARYFSRDFTRHLDRDFGRYYAKEFALYFARDFGRNFSREFGLGRLIPRKIARYLGVFRGDFINGFPVAGLARNRSLISIHAEKEPQLVPQKLRAGLAGEAWIALATTARSSVHEERLSYAIFRLHNRLLFEIWSEIDQRLPENPSPAHLALYFALGWAQSTTTWAWPDSERWRTLFAAGPGEHWLVRSQWHLCKLTDDPASKDDDAGLRAALRDGHGDESLPGYAARLGEVLGIEG